MTFLLFFGMMLILRQKLLSSKFNRSVSAAGSATAESAKAEWHCSEWESLQKLPLSTLLEQTDASIGWSS